MRSTQSGKGLGVDDGKEVKGQDDVHNRLFGIPADWSANADSSHSFRLMLGARSSSLAELDISPMVSAQFVL